MTGFTIGHRPSTRGIVEHLEKFPDSTVTFETLVGERENEALYLIYYSNPDGYIEEGDLATDGRLLYDYHLSGCVPKDVDLDIQATTLYEGVLVSTDPVPFFQALIHVERSV